MPPSRSCQQCRSAKAKCDLVTPICGRCTARALTCSGAAQGNLLFLNENPIAQRNSWLARRPRRGSQRQSSTSGSQSPQKPAEMTDEDLQKLYYWLSDAPTSEVSQPLRRDIETRAVERFFLDWTLNPSNDGLSPGYLHDLPALYATAHPGSILWNAVRAIAFADLKDYDNGSFGVKARQSYGAALTRMRAIVDDERKLVQDRILAALLVIDIFELVYLSRREPLGPHKDAMKRILFLRGEQQFQERTQFELWRTAQQRLQAQQITQRDTPNEGEQLAWMSKLNASLPDIHVCVDVERMVVLCSAGRKVMAEAVGTIAQVAETAKRAEELLQTMREVATSMEEWAAQVDDGWQPRRLDAPTFVEGDEDESPEMLVFKPPFAHLPTLKYSDPWLAQKWNFHAAAQIVLRQSMIEMIEILIDLRSPIDEDDDEYEEAYIAESAVLKETTMKLADTIIQACIPLLGSSREELGVYPRGKMARKFFAGGAMWIVSQAKFASQEQKSMAMAVLEWIARAHRLG